MAIEFGLGSLATVTSHPLPGVGFGIGQGEDGVGESCSIAGRSDHPAFPPLDRVGTFAIKEPDDWYAGRHVGLDFGRNRRREHRVRP